MLESGIFMYREEVMESTHVFFGFFLSHRIRRHKCGLVDTVK